MFSEKETRVQKLVSVLATSTSMTNTRKKALERVPCIHYPVRFKKDADKTPVEALIDSNSEVNAIHPSFAKQLGLPIRLTDVRVQKIDGTILDTYKMVLAAILSGGQSKSSKIL